MPIRIALIGVSGYGECHYRSILSLVENGVAELAAATIINAEAEQQKCLRLRGMGCRLYRDYRDMLRHERGKIDLCCIPTGIPWHCVMTVEAIKAGMHVLVEKPAATTLEEADAMQSMAVRMQREVFVGFQYMYPEPIWQAKRMLLNHGIGSLERVRICGLWPRSEDYYTRTDWAGKITLGQRYVYDSPASNALSHFIFMGLFLAGKTEEGVGRVSSVQAKLYRANQIESFDTASVCIQLLEGPDIIVNLSHATEVESPVEVIVDGEGGYFSWRQGNDMRLQLGGEDSADVSLDFPSEESARDQMFYHICSHLRGEDAPTCTLAMTREHTKLIKALHESAPIVDISYDCLKKRTVGGAQYRYIPELDRQLLSAHQQGKILGGVATHSFS